ncbi:hypothetical protein F441_01633 [Phytophthora nicotianae CJ01A1]|uniref:Uncharacterized protein n=1 Tax=Phytophthora nicotianae CJ01A1 TaxID=1317063 RepID=W2XSK8_PHYNI|nr:hypothetical protein F441_01633 [Phytophthora nicotianae CJ01A1]
MELVTTRPLGFVTALSPREMEAMELIMVLSEIMVMEIVLVVTATIPLDYVEEKVAVEMPAACALVGTMNEGVEKALSVIVCVLMKLTDVGKEVVLNRSMLLEWQCKMLLL